MQQELIDDMKSTAESIIEDLQKFYDHKYDDENEQNLYEYLMDNCGIKFIVGRDLSYDSCIICMGCGGPNIYLDTYQKEIRGYWGCDNEIHVEVPRHLIEMIDDEIEYEYNERRELRL